jgi:hypothetical protein
MKNKMKFFVIDPKSRTISDLEIDKDTWDYKQIYKLLGISNTFEYVWLGESPGDGPFENGLYIDGEGMLKNAFAGPGNSQTMWYFQIINQGGHEYTIAGPAIVVGTDEEGDTDSTNFSREHIESIVGWVPDGIEVTPEPPKIIAF